MAFFVRDAETGDLAFLRVILREAAYPPETRQQPLEEALAPLEVSRYLEGWGREGDLGVVAVGDRSEQVGAAWCRLFPPSQPGYGFVDERTPELTIAVLPAFRGRGVGSALLQELADRARKQGYEALSLSVSPGNATAIHLYVGAGFERVDSRDEQWTMTLRL